MGDNSSLTAMLSMINKNLEKNDGCRHEPNLQDSVTKATGTISNVSAGTGNTISITTVNHAHTVTGNKPIMNPPHVESTPVPHTAKILCYYCAFPGWAREPKYCGSDCNFYENCEHVDDNSKGAAIPVSHTANTINISNIRLPARNPNKVICYKCAQATWDGSTIYCTSECRDYLWCPCAEITKKLDGSDMLLTPTGKLPDLDYVKEHTDYLSIISTHILEEMIQSFIIAIDDIDFDKYLVTNIPKDIQYIGVEKLDSYKERLELTSMEYEVVSRLIKETKDAMNEILKERWKEYAFSDRT